jgi:hypothetical protein
MIKRAITLGALVLAAATWADRAHAAVEPTRTVDAILADHVAALGGKAVLGRHKSMHLKRKITIKGMGIEGDEERFAATADRLLTIISIPGMGTVRQGSDGKRFWSEDPINGLRLLTGIEKEQARLDGSWNAELRMTKLYKKITVVPAPANATASKAAASDKAGAAAALECLELVPRVGSPMTACFDGQSHQRVFQTGRQMTPQGEMPVEAHFSQWQDFDGVSLPTLEETTAGPITSEERLLEVKFDEKIDPSLFKLRRTAASAPAAKATKPLPKPTPAAAPAEATP